MRTYIITLILTVSLWSGDQVFGQRPTAPKLFPQKTLLYARVDDTRDMKEKLSMVSMGRVANDPKIKPILESFYSTLTASIEGMQQAIGINLDELLSIPNGELAIALVPTKKEPVFCLLIEAGEELPALELMIGRLDANESLVKTKKQVGKIEVVSMGNSNRPNEQMAYFIDSGVFVATNNSDYTETLAKVWTGNGIDHKPLADNRDFTTILSRCVGTEGERPQLSFFVDPIALFREATKSNASSMIALGSIRTVGLDGIKAVGGSVILAPNDFDSIVHGHLLMDNNRRGVLRTIRPKSGSTDPESWVADDVVSYGTLNWDIAKTVKAIAEMVDTFMGEEAFEERVVKEASKNLGVDFRKDILELIDDRISIVQTIVPPKHFNSQSNLYAIHIKEPNRFNTEVLPQIFEKIRSRNADLKSKLVGDISVYYFDVTPQGEVRNMRIPKPCACILGKVLLVSDSLEAIEQAIRTDSSGDNLLSDALEFKLVRTRIKAQLKDVETSILSYQRPEESLRLIYDLARDPANIKNLEDMGDNNPFLKSVVTALKSNTLPPFESISKYFAPGGAFVVEEDNGLHYTGFSLRRE